MIDVEKQVAHWRKGANDALDDAQYLILGGRITLGLFAIHLALEKAIKAHVIKKTNKMPPRIHNLLSLAQLISLPLSAEQERLLAALNAFNIRGRYPDMPGESPSFADAQTVLERAKEMFEWLMKRL